MNHDQTYQPLFICDELVHKWVIMLLDKLNNVTFCSIWVTQLESLVSNNVKYFEAYAID